MDEVDPKRGTSGVGGRQHGGHFRPNDRRTGPGTAARPYGGAMAYSVSLRLPSSLIQSVVHAGARTSSTSTCAYPAAEKARVRSSRIVSMAGHPEYVGVIVTTTRSPPSQIGRAHV